MAELKTNLLGFSMNSPIIGASGTVGYGVEYVQLGEATADMVVELLCDGKTPADLPFQTFDNGIATINTETCEALGLDLDTVKKAFAPYCTEVVEVTTAENFN